MLTSLQTYGKVLTDVRQIDYLFSIITTLTCNTESVRSSTDGGGVAVHQTTKLMGTLGIELGMGEIFNKTADPDVATDRDGMPHASPRFMPPSTRSRSSWPSLFTFSSTTILTLITRCWWYLGNTYVRVLQNNYFTPLHASLYLCPACLIVSLPYL